MHAGEKEDMRHPLSGECEPAAAHRAAETGEYDGCTLKEKDHRYYISGGEELELSFEDAARKILFDPKGSVPIGAGTYKAAACPNPFSVCFVKAEYHKKLNAIRLMDIIEVADVGTPINRLTGAGHRKCGAPCKRH